jgi:hypothetical protein
VREFGFGKWAMIIDDPNHGKEVNIVLSSSVVFYKFVHPKAGRSAQCAN